MGDIKIPLYKLYKSMKDNDKEKTYCVYKHTSPNGKSYIGITSMKPPSQRWKNGKGYSHNKYFTNAINKYGWDNFTHEIIEDNLTEAEAQNLEKKLIEKYNTFDSDNGYNCTSGGEIGKQHTEEVRRNQSELAKKLWQDEEFRNKQIEFRKTLVGEKNPNYGNHKLAGKNYPFYGKKMKPETIEKLKNRIISDETRRKISEAAKNRMTPEMREHLRKIHTGRHPSEESRKKMSESQKARWTDELREEWSKKFSGKNNGMYGKHHTEETKQLLREKFSGENSVWFGKHHTEESKQKAHDSCTWKVPVIQLTLQGEFIKEFDSYADAAKAMDGNVSSIIGCCNGTYKSAYGFMWVKKEEYDSSDITPYKNDTYKAVVQLDKDWSYINKYISLREAARAINGLHQNIGQSCKYKGIRTSKGFRWMFEEDYINFNKDKDKEN